MFEIKRPDPNTLELIGRFDASHERSAGSTLAGITGDTVIDFEKLQYISSSGLGLLFATQARLNRTGHEIKLRNLSPHIRDIFHMAGFDKIFTIE